MAKLLRITTVSISLKTLLKGQHRFMTENGFEVLGVSSLGPELNEVAQQEAVRVTTVEMTRTIAPFRDIHSLWNFYKLCKKERPLIVHSHTPKAGIVGMLGAKLAGVPIRLHTVAGLPLMEAKGVKRWVLDIVEKLTYHCASKVYPNSKGLYDFILAQNYTSKEKLHVIANGSSNGIDTSFYTPNLIDANLKQDLKQQLGIKENDFVFVFVGRLVGDKGINELVEAFEGLLGIRDKGQGEKVKLLLVGSFENELDPLQTETLNVIETHSNIICVGFQKDVRPYFTISDCLVFPSYREGFPNVVMQAGAMGLPSIVTDINGCNEIIVDGENGIIIPSKNTFALKEAMEQMMQDSILFQKLKQNARPMIQSRYEQKLVWEALLEEYRRLLEEMK